MIEEEKKPAKPVSSDCVRWLFLRLIGLTYLIAFVSAGIQINGLIGSQGIMPAHTMLTLTKSWYARQGIDAAVFLLSPSIFWFNCSDAFLQGACLTGVLASLLAVAGLLTMPSLIVCYLLYLSIIHAGQEFMSYQWDWLLLEVGVLSVFLAPAVAAEAPWKFAKQAAPPSKIILWLLRLLMFKLMFLSGVCKLASHDPTWADLTALKYHWETQPLPTPLAWAAEQMPMFLQKGAVLGTFFIELLVPFLIFTPRRIRVVAAGLFALLQINIALTGNYTFFNILTLALCLPLLDDAVVSKVLPAKLVSAIQAVSTQAAGRVRVIYHRVLAVAYGILALGAAHIASPVSVLGALAEPFGVYNSYGLFAVMTRERNEIIVEGSDDKVTWLEYQLPFKPGDIYRAPPIVAPFQPRLDWQLWFAALSTADLTPWFTSFVARILQGDESVLRLLSHNPFPAHPPKYVRANLYRYHFTTFQEFASTHAWWKRTLVSEYFPAVSLDELEKNR